VSKVVHATINCAIQAQCHVGVLNCGDPTSNHPISLQLQSICLSLGCKIEEIADVVIAIITDIVDSGVTYQKHKRGSGSDWTGAANRLT
jgi:hypothetical protein